MIRRFLVRAGELYQRQITTALIGIWNEKFQDCDSLLLGQALDRLERTCSYFPTPADVFKALDAQVRHDQNSAAEAAWGYVGRYITEYEWGDGPGGFIPGAPPMEGRADEALRAAGGVRQYLCATPENLSWMKKRFVEAYIRSVANPAFMLPENARELLSELTGNGDRKMLPSGESGSELTR